MAKHVIEPQRVDIGAALAALDNCRSLKIGPRSVSAANFSTEDRCNVHVRRKPTESLAAMLIRAALLVHARHCPDSKALRTKREIAQLKRWFEKP